MKHLILSALCLFTLATLSAQTGRPSQILTAEPAGTVNLREVKEDFAPRLQHLEAPAPGSDSYRGHLQKLKSQMPPKRYGKVNEPGHRSQVEQPRVLVEFEGNKFDANNPGAPNDNDLAVNNDGQVISVKNKSINVYDESGNLISGVSLEAFSDTLGIPNDKYDPRVVYDPEADRFVMVFLRGRTDTTSFIVVGFSQSSDPSGLWAMYSLPGNPLNDTSWSDFPNIGITNDELFITINLLTPGVSWKEGFRQTVVWQVDKESGYQGNTLQMRWWDGINWLGKPLRNLSPVQGGSNPIGPDMYFISNRNFDSLNDTFWVIHIDDRLTSPNPQLTIQTVQADVPYGLPPNAAQPGGHFFDTNDARVLDAFEEDGNIQFVGNTRDFTTNRAAIYHGILTDLNGTPHINGHIIGHPYLEFGYPSLAYTGNGLTEEAIIAFEHSGDTVNPGNSAIYYENNEYSDLLILKEGETYVNLINGPYERWGDYTGTQRVYDEPGRVWVSAAWGQLIKGSGGIGSTDQETNGTWIASLSAPNLVGLEEAQPQPQVLAYPIPASDMVYVEFELQENAYLTFELFNLQGQKVRTLLRQPGKSGQNRFAFSAQPLAAGQYLLVINSGSGQVLSKKIIVE